MSEPRIFVHDVEPDRDSESGRKRHNVTLRLEGPGPIESLFTIEVDAETEDGEVLRVATRTLHSVCAAFAKLPEDLSPLLDPDDVQRWPSLMRRKRERARSRASVPKTEA